MLETVVILSLTPEIWNLLLQVLVMETRASLLNAHLPLVIADSVCPSLQVHSDELLISSAQVLVTDPKELEKIRDRESDITKERVNKILGTGANVILTTKGIDDLCLKYFVEAGAIACRRVPKDDLRGAALLMAMTEAKLGIDVRLAVELGSPKGAERRPEVACLC